MNRRKTVTGYLVLCAFALFVAISVESIAAPSPAPSVTASPGAREAVDRETPRRAMRGFLKEAKEGDYLVAASYLDLRALSAEAESSKGPLLAEKLGYVIEHRKTINLAQIPDDPEGDPAAKSATYVVDTLYLGEEPVPVTLSRVRFADGVSRWLIAQTTVEAIPAIDAAFGPRPIGVPIPASLTRPAFLGNEPWQWLGLLIAAFVAVLAARALAAVSVRGTAYLVRTTRPIVREALSEAGRRPLRLVLAALIFRAFLEPLQLTTSVLGACEHVVFSAVVVGTAWLVVRVLGAATLWLEARADNDGSDAVRGRSVRTQAMLLHRVATVTIGFVASAIVLVQFDFVRNVGVSLLASAGVVSVVVGLAAQKSLSAIIGGIQFSAAQPVRMGDQVVVEGEFGEIEEINLTYAVVKLWDKRRLILPITYFLEKPFQNWTRSATDLVGAVLLHVDYGMPISTIRDELKRICDADPLWDKRTCGLQVTDSNETHATLRALVSASDASRLWDLRCNIRERLITFVQGFEQGKYLAHTRHSIEAAEPNGAPGIATPFVSPQATGEAKIPPNAES